jgi:hypothetical protein
MGTHAGHDNPGHDNPALGILVVTVAAIIFGLGVLAVQEWTPLMRTLENAVQASPAPQATPAPGVCRRCGVIESVRSLDRTEAGRMSGITVRGLGDDLMSVLALAAGALVGNRLRAEAPAATGQEVTVRFEDGSSRVLRSASAREWEPGERVKVIHGRVFPNS